MDFKKLKKEIKELMSERGRKPLVSSDEPVNDQRIRPFESNAEIRKKILKKMRTGMAAGEKDTKKVGAIEHKTQGMLQDLPKFTPYNCNFFKQTISAEQQKKLLEGDRGCEKLTSDKTNPIYDTKRFKEFITSDKDKQFVQSFHKDHAEQLLNEMVEMNKNLLYSGEQEITEKQRERET